METFEDTVKTGEGPAEPIGLPTELIGTLAGFAASEIVNPPLHGIWVSPYTIEISVKFAHFSSVS